MGERQRQGPAVAVSGVPVGLVSGIAALEAGGLTSEQAKALATNVFRTLLRLRCFAQLC